jgi:6-pyruvoyltetrahydropterin/6-carboxytetrahydropterin synthase
MELKLHTEGWFDAAHHLENYDGACKNLHGHTYFVELWVVGDSDQLDEKTKILFDFGNLKKILKQYDHNGDLTDKLGINSTAEMLTITIAEKLHYDYPGLTFTVRVYEQVAPKRSWCETTAWGDKYVKSAVSSGK